MPILARKSLCGAFGLQLLGLSCDHEMKIRIALVVVSATMKSITHLTKRSNAMNCSSWLLAMSCTALMLGGCATLADSVKAKGTGIYRVYDKPYDEVWTETIEIIEKSNLELVSKDKEGGQILAIRGANGMSWGENVAIFVSKEGENSRSTVEVVSRRSMATNVFATNWETYILGKLDAKFASK